MIIGKISENREALIELEVIGVNWQQRIVATIDTGFDGYLTLSLYMINQLGLRPAGYRQAILGDGNRVVFNLFRARVVWVSKTREVPVLQVEGDPLVGMALLDGNRVIMNVVKDGQVRIENLPLVEMFLQIRIEDNWHFISSMSSNVTRKCQTMNLMKSIGYVVKSLQDSIMM